MFLTSQEVIDVDNWLKLRDIDKFVMLECTFTSSQSYWNRTHTNIVLEHCKKKGYTVLFTHREDPNLNSYNEICESYCLDVGFRYMPAFYNKAQAFIGVSSGISCAVHTNQCKTDIPHLEFVKGAHWATTMYKKGNKQIFFEISVDKFKEIITKV
jgi:hypothetical protein